MKKSLSLLVAIAMVFSMFASVAFAADELTAEQKYEALVEAGIFEGFDDGEAHLDEAMTRAQAAKIIALLTGYTEDTEVEDAGFTDLKGAGWAADYINYVAGLGIVEGMGDMKFAPSVEVTIEQLAKMVVETLEIEVDEEATVDGEVSDWAVAYVAAAVEAGLVEAQEDYTVSALRELLVVASYTAYEIISVPAELGLGTVTQTGKGEITVNFNKAATADEQKDLTFAVANGLVKYTVTTKWAEDGKSAVLTSNYLPAAVYTVTVGEFEAVQVTVADEVPTKLEVGATTLQKAAGQNLNVKLFNQFNKEIESPVLNVSVYNATYGKTITPSADFKVDLSSDTVARVDDNVVVTASHYGSGLTATKSFKVVAGSSATAITLAAPTPLKDKARISVNEDGIVLPYTLADQYGGKILLPELATEEVGNDKQVVIGGITFLVNDSTIITEVSVDEDGVLKFNTGEQSGTVVISALNPSTGANASISFKVEAAAKVKTFQMSNPGVVIAADEEVKVPFQAADSFGAPIAAKDVDLSQVDIKSSVNFTTGYPKLNAKGELVFNFDPTDVTTDRTAYIYAYVDGAQAGQLQLEVRKEAEMVKVNGVTVAKYFENGAQVEFKPSKITYLDSYNRTKEVSAWSAVDITVPSPLVLDTANNTLTANGTLVGKAEIKVSLSGVTGDPEFKTTVEVVKSSDVKSYSIKSVGTLFADNGATVVGATYVYDKGIELVGKLAGGSEVVIVQSNAYDLVTTSNPNVVKVVGSKTLRGVDEGTATVAAYKGSTKLAEIEVTVSKAKPVATTVSFGSDTYKLNVDGNPEATTKTVTVTIKDQYGVVMSGVVGLVATSDSDVVSVNGMDITAEGVGTATLTYLTTNGATGTALVEVEA